MTKGAIISRDNNYRYQLWRIWDDSLPKVLFIMHNPSTADAEKDDKTITRCINFAKSWGCGGLYVGNIFPFRETNPAKLKRHSIDTLEMYRYNQLHIDIMKNTCSIHVLAYGNPVDNRFTVDFITKYNDCQCLKVLKNGNPGHPLYLSADLKPIPFSPNFPIV